MKISKLIKGLIFTIIILIFIAIFAAGGYMTYVDANSTKAKEYLFNKYEINSKDWIAYKFTEYVYEDITNCNTLWFKKCTADKTLAFKYTFINKDKNVIIVTEDIDGNYTDDFNGTLKENKHDDENTNNDIDLVESN